MLQARLCRHFPDMPGMGKRQKSLARGQTTQGPASSSSGNALPAAKISLTSLSRPSSRGTLSASTFAATRPPAARLCWLPFQGSTGHGWARTERTWNTVTWNTTTNQWWPATWKCVTNQSLLANHKTISAPPQMHLMAVIAREMLRLEATSHCRQVPQKHQAQRPPPAGTNPMAAIWEQTMRTLNTSRNRPMAPEVLNRLLQAPSKRR